MAETIDIKQLGPMEEDNVSSNCKSVNKRRSGGFKAACFIIGMELCERLAYYAIQSNLLHYLTKVLQQSSTEAFKNVLTWTGISLIVPIAGGFLADTYWGRYRTIAILSIVYLIGLLLLTLTVWLPPPVKHDGNGNGNGNGVNVRLFFFSLYLVSIGAGGMKPCLEAFGADQFDEESEAERRSKSSFFNWWFFALCLGALLAITVVVYVENNVSWALGFGIPTAVMAAGCLLFFAGSGTYRCCESPAGGHGGGGSPLTRIAQVCVAALRNAKEELPQDPRLLYEEEEIQAVRGVRWRQLEHSQCLRFLDKAALVAPVRKEKMEMKRRSDWRVCTVTQVEEVKLVAGVLPIWLATVMYGVVYAQASTVYVSQVSSMETSRVPPASFQASMTLVVLLWVPIYERVAGGGAHMTTLRRIGVGLFLSVLSVAAAALVDGRRLEASASASARMSAWWTVPQYVLLGIADVYTLVGEQEFFYDQVPDSMRSLGMALYLSGNGLGYFASTFIQMAVHWASTRHGGRPWIQPYDVERSRYDYYFWLLAFLSSLNLAAFVLLANAYSYKRVKPQQPHSGLDHNHNAVDNNKRVKPQQPHSGLDHNHNAVDNNKRVKPQQPHSGLDHNHDAVDNNPTPVAPQAVA